MKKIILGACKRILFIAVKTQPFVLFLALLDFTLLAQSPAVMPNTSSINHCFPDTDGYEVITVGPVGRDYSDLQAAINNANPGSILALDAGATFSGSFSLPEKIGDKWIIITSSRIDLLAAPETRIKPTALTGNALYPTYRDAMPKVVSTNLSGLPCFRTLARANHYRLVGLEISVDTNVTNSYGLVFFGDASAAQNTLNKVPHDLIIDRCYIHGHTKANIMKAGVLLNCANAAVLDSYISDFHSIGYDSYAIGGTNGPGPFIILNNYLEAAGENILFGGAAPAIPNLVPADIEVRNNYFYKPFAWRVAHPDYAGKHWTIKNLFELKTGIRVLLDGNIMENVWADLPTGQSGYAILLTVRAEGGAAPQANVSDINITNNIIRHTGAGISLSGHDSPTPSLQSQRIRIANNLFDDINGPANGDANTGGPNDGTFIKIGDPSDVLIDHNTVFQSGPVTWAYGEVKSVSITNNIFNCFLSKGGYQGIYGPGFAKDGNGPIGKYFPGISDAGQHFNKNVLIGGTKVNYSNYTTISQNYFPKVAGDVGFVNLNSGNADYRNFKLSNTSVYKDAATNGQNIGVDFNLLDAALNPKPRCKIAVATSIQPQAMQILIHPNPFKEQIILDSETTFDSAVLSLYNLLGQEVKHIGDISVSTLY
ncbi:MAG: hypothetical protein ACOYOA_12515 [Saprospiraceae bacterium]